MIGQSWCIPHKTFFVGAPTAHHNPNENFLPYVAPTKLKSHHCHKEKETTCSVIFTSLLLSFLLSSLPISPPPTPIRFFLSLRRNALTSTDCGPYGRAASVSLITAIAHGEDVGAKSKQISRSEETSHHRYAHNKVQLVQACQLAQCHSDRCNSSLWLYPGLLGLAAVENGVVCGCLLLHDRSWYHRR